MRPYLLFISGIAGWTGLMLGPTNPMNSWIGWLSLIAFFFSYGFGQALTDCFQLDTDRISAPYRPLSQGIVSPRSLGVVAAIGLLLVSLILILLNSNNLILCGLSVIGLITYTYFKRNYWWAGPFYNAWIVALLPIMGYFIVMDGSFELLSRIDLINLILLTFFAYTNFVLIGYLKDISADRITNYKTFPVVFGWNSTVYLGYVFALLSTLLAFFMVQENALALMIALLGTLVAFSGLLFAHFTQEKTEANASYPISATVRSFTLWHLAVGVACWPSNLVFALMFYLIFEISLQARPMKEQI